MSKEIGKDRDDEPEPYREREYRQHTDQKVRKVKPPWKSKTPSPLLTRGLLRRFYYAQLARFFFSLLLVIPRIA